MNIFKTLAIHCKERSRRDRKEDSRSNWVVYGDIPYYKDVGYPWMFANTILTIRSQMLEKQLN
jgi:hypothetical protein